MLRCAAPSSSLVCRCYTYTVCVSVCVSVASYYSLFGSSDRGAQQQAQQRTPSFLTFEAFEALYLGTYEHTRIHRMRMYYILLIVLLTFYGSNTRAHVHEPELRIVCSHSPAMRLKHTHVRPHRRQLLTRVRGLVCIFNANTRRNTCTQQVYICACATTCATASIHS